MGSVGDLAELPVIWHDDDPSTYDEARVGRVFNQRRPKRYPVGVVQASSEKHIIDAVKLAKQRGCRVSVRSGGHSWAAWSVREGAILIDLGKYHSLEFDEAEMVVRASPSTTGRVLNGMLLSKGYMFPGGHCPDVGIGGFLLQGGMGWNCRVSSMLYNMFQLQADRFLEELGMGLRIRRRRRRSHCQRRAPTLQCQPESGALLDGSRGWAGLSSDRDQVSSTRS